MVVAAFAGGAGAVLDGARGTVVYAGETHLAFAVPLRSCGGHGDVVHGTFTDTDAAFVAEIGIGGESFITHGEALVYGVNESGFEGGEGTTHYAFTTATLGKCFGDFEESATGVHQLGEFERLCIGVESGEQDVIIWHLHRVACFESDFVG